MLRDLSQLTAGGAGILGTPLVGVLAAEIPTGFPLPPLLLNDIDAGDPAGCLYRVEILSWPSAGTLTVEENGAFAFTGAADATYTGNERVSKYNPATGLIGAMPTTYSLTVGQAVVTPTAPTVTSMTITPASVTLAGGAAQTFIPNIVGANSPSQAVTWVKVGGGTLDAMGNFVAPAATSSSQTITITARSVQDPSFAATATVTVAAVVIAPPAPTVTGVVVSPSSLTLAGDTSQQLTAVVSGTNSPSQAGSWSATAGTVTSGGLFTAPPATGTAQEITVTFTSEQDPAWSGHAVVTVAAVVVTPPVVTPPAPVAGTTPGAPTEVTVVAVVEGILVSARAPKYTGSSALVNYTITASTGESVDVDALPATIVLPPLASAFVTVTANNADGPGAASAPSAVATPMGTLDPANTPSPVPAPRSRVICM